MYLVLGGNRERSEFFYEVVVIQRKERRAVVRQQSGSRAWILAKVQRAESIYYIFWENVCFLFSVVCPCV